MHVAMRHCVGDQFPVRGRRGAKSGSGLREAILLIARHFRFLFTSHVDCVTHLFFAGDYVSQGCPWRRAQLCRALAVVWRITHCWAASLVLFMTSQVYIVCVVYKEIPVALFIGQSFIGQQI